MFAQVKKRTVTLLGLLGLAANPPVWAALPTPVAPSTAPAAGDWIALIQGYIKDGGLVLGLAIAVLGFLWVAYLAFAKFNEARQRPILGLPTRQSADRLVAKETFQSAECPNPDCGSNA